MNKLLILSIVVLVLSIIYILKFRETFASQQCNNLDIDLIDPKHPDCISKCVHDYTWTEANISASDNISKKDKEGTLNDDAIMASLKTSGCFKCLRNFYHGIELIKENTCGE